MLFVYIFDEINVMIVFLLIYGSLCIYLEFFRRLVIKYGPNLDMSEIYLGADENSIVLGTHDSCSYCINSECELSEDNDAFPVLVLLGKAGKVISARWCRTQDANLSEQLVAGIRYLDLRVLHRELDGLFYFVHGQFAGEVLKELLLVKSFLQEHPKEVVLLDFNHFYCFFKPDSSALLQEAIVRVSNPFKLNKPLVQVFGTMLAPRSEQIPSLSELWSGGYQVICFYHKEADSQVMWRPETISSPWPNTVAVEKLIDFLNSHPP